MRQVELEILEMLAEEKFTVEKPRCLFDAIHEGWVSSQHGKEGCL